MAGYVIYSLDWEKFRQFVDKPSKAQLTALAERLRDGLDEPDHEFDDDDPVLDWPTDVKALSKIAAERLALPDW